MGLTIYNQTGTSLTINTEYDIAPILKQSFINCFCESTSGYIWVGTRNGLFGLKNYCSTQRLMDCPVMLFMAFWKIVTGVCG